MVAVLAGNAHLVRVLLVFGADANGVREKDGLSVRHLSAAAAAEAGEKKKIGEAYREILAHLVAFGARPCPPASSDSGSNCLPGCLEDQEKGVEEKLKTLYASKFHSNAAHQLAVDRLLGKGSDKSTEASTGSSSSKSKTPAMMICFDGKFEFI